MILWLNGAFGSGKTTTAFELNRRLSKSFVYDPENVGYFIRLNTPKVFSKGDFQDMHLWREMNYKILRMITEMYDGIVIVPMTLVNSDYYNEIIGKLISDGIEVRHFILYSSKEEIKRRIKKRTLPFIGKDAFAMDSIDRCMKAFDNFITEKKIYTENMSVDKVVDKIAELCNLSLSNNKKSKMGKFIYRAKMMIKHVRCF